MTVVLVGVSALTAGCEDAAEPEATGGKPDGTPPETVEVVNTTCPIMGEPIDSDAVPAELTRTWQDKTIGFCCAGRPEKWDELSDEQKQAKLAGATPETE